MPHIHDPGIDFTVETFIVYNGKVLLRKHDKYGIWLGVGGHIERNEDPNKAAIRECKEEVGLRVELVERDSDKRCKHICDVLGRPGEEYRELVPPMFLNRHRISKTHEHITLAYAAISKTDKLRLSRKEKSPECRWMTQEEVMKHPDIKPSVQLYATVALHQVLTMHDVQHGR